MGKKLKFTLDLENDISIKDTLWIELLEDDFASFLYKKGFRGRIQCNITGNSTYIEDKKK